jgi:diadenylate cyclase
MELFKIGFIPVKLTDIIDVIIVSYIFYKLYTILRGTIASQILFALMLIIATSLLANAFNLQALGWLLSKLTDIWLIAFIILFQPEIRRLLLIIGKGRVASWFFRFGTKEDESEIVDACDEIRAKGWGALLVITRTAGLQNIVETGVLLQSRVSKELLLSIFYPKSTLHDGAVIVRNNRIEAARCLLPLSDTEQIGNNRLGTRHRAALGISASTDAIAIVISEENNTISIANFGRLYVTRDINDLKSKLEELVAKSGELKND